MNRHLPIKIALTLCLATFLVACKPLFSGSCCTHSPPPVNQWTWVTGASAANASAVFGTLGVAAPGNQPPARGASASWKDAAGTLWLFGGLIYGTGGNSNYFNDLWQFNPNKKLWTWQGGSDLAGAPGSYGTLGVAAAGNQPGAREGGIAWTDTAGKFWLFGGEGYDSTGTEGALADLWQYNPTTKQWTWMGGPNLANATPVFGTQGIAAAANLPPPRNGGVSWVDPGGKVWLFGGNGNTTQGNAFLNDVWRFDPSTQQWTWMAGSATPNTTGVYGTQGVAAAGNQPGGRIDAALWLDISGSKVWMFGGIGNDGAGNPGQYGDLWQFNLNTLQWTWISGPSTPNAPAVYGQQGVAAGSNQPGGRVLPLYWRDTKGMLWMYGGVQSLFTGTLADLWEFNPNDQNWTWVSGPQTLNAAGVYSHLGVPNALNQPGARAMSVNWVDSTDRLWLFGGFNALSLAGITAKNDVWSYQVNQGGCVKSGAGLC